MICYDTVIRCLNSINGVNEKGVAHLGVGGGVNQGLLEANPLTQNRIGVCKGGYNRIEEPVTKPNDSF